MLNLLTRLDNGLGLVLRWFCIVSMALLTVVVSGVVLVRFLPIAKLSWSDEAVEWLFAWLVFMGAAALWRRREHFCVETLSERLKFRRLGLFHLLFVELLSALFFILFTYFSFKLAFSANDRSPILEWPRPIWYACMPVSGAIMSGYSLSGVVKVAGALFDPRKTCPGDLKD